MALNLFVSLREIDVFSSCFYFLVNFIKMRFTFIKLGYYVRLLLVSQVGVLFLSEEVLNRIAFLTEDSVLNLNSAEFPVVKVKLTELKSG